MFARWTIPKMSAPGSSFLMTENSVYPTVAVSHQILDYILKCLFDISFIYSKINRRTNQRASLFHVCWPRASSNGTQLLFNFQINNVLKLDCFGFRREQMWRHPWHGPPCPKCSFARNGKRKWAKANVAEADNRVHRKRRRTLAMVERLPFWERNQPGFDSTHIPSRATHKWLTAKPQNLIKILINPQNVHALCVMKTD